MLLQADLFLWWGVQRLTWERNRTDHATGAVQFHWLKHRGRGAFEEQQLIASSSDEDRGETQNSLETSTTFMKEWFKQVWNRKVLRSNLLCHLYSSMQRCMKVSLVVSGCVLCLPIKFYVSKFWDLPFLLRTFQNSWKRALWYRPLVNSKACQITLIGRWW